MKKISYEEIEKYIESIPGIVVIDMKGNVVYVNDQCAGYFGMARDSIYGKNITEVFPQTKMMEGLEIDEPRLMFYNSYMGIGISVQVPIYEGVKKIGLLEYDVTQSSEKLYDLSKDYGNFLDQELLNLEKEIIEKRDSRYSISNIIGGSSAILEVKKKIITAAKSNSTVIIKGETGTGKELVAHAIHNLSGRRRNRLVKINSTAFPETLIESELFGYEEGAFTGAKKSGKKGKFETADKGTLFIDEINNMPMSVQPKLLRVLQEHEIERIGGNTDVSVDVRIIAATNENLQDLIYQNRFREDLYYRLNVIEIEVPTLRERLEDIDDLVSEKIKELNIELGTDVERATASALHFLKKYKWPGNVRQLHNVVERAMNFSKGKELTKEDFETAMVDAWGQVYEIPDNKEEIAFGTIEDVRNRAETKLILDTLKMCNNNKTKAAERLNIARPLLYQKIKRLGIRI
ncbi:MAG: sigma 54-interacting transcriptional regulator [Anaerovoracaceae bacterium]|jgi:transcriptional regulator with PAS, ATPase and Fis domain|nr:sigma 54-interacting transcriptional regulator [Anaerovoracaceae bacterium]